MTNLTVSAAMYRSVYRAVTQAAHRVPYPTSTVARSVTGRRGARNRWIAWASGARDGQRIWLHGASVGEVMAALPVVRRLRVADPNTTLVLSYTSPSVADWTFPEIAYADFLPLDEAGAVEPVLDAVRPHLVLLSRGDLWPEFLRAAKARGAHVALTGATLSPDTWRLRWPMRSLLSEVAAGLEHVGAVTLEDAGRWRRLGVHPEVLRVTGDPRHDYVLERAMDARPAAAVRRWADHHPVLIAGSVEESDLRALMPAMKVLTTGMGWHAVIVPHQPDARMVRAISGAAHEAGVLLAEWSPAREPPPEAACLLAAARGTLFDLYLAADLAFVGGGYRQRGLHSVIEPAALAVPVVAGPSARRHPDMSSLLAVGGGAIPSDASPEALRDVLCGWVRDANARRAAGVAARGTLTEGAATRESGYLKDVLGW